MLLGMLILIRFFRFLFVAVLMGAPFLLISWALGGKVGALVGAVFFLTAGVVLSVLSESIVKKVMCVKVADLPSGLGQSLGTGTAKEPVKNLDEDDGAGFFIFPSAYSSIFVMRRLGSKASIFLSQGLLAHSSEREIREMLHAGLKATQERGLVLRSFCAVIAVVILKLVPAPWVESAFTESVLPKEPSLTPLRLIFSAVFMSLAKIWMDLSKVKDQKLPKDWNGASLGLVYLRL